MLHYKPYRIAKNIITALCLMMFFVSCSNKLKEVSLVQYNGKFPDESAENMTITMSDSGKTSFIIETPLLNRYYGDSSYADCPRGITVVSYNEHGQKQAVLTAGYASDVANTQIQASHGVVIHDVIKNETVETDQIIWDQRKGIIYSVVLVKQTKADGSVNWGDGFEADEHFTKYTIKHPRGEMVAIDF